MAIISKGITLGYKAGLEAHDFTLLTNLQEIPELNGEKEAIEITTLADAAHKFTDGIMNYGDSLAFKFLYDGTQFKTLCDLNEEAEWQVSLPDAKTCTFKATSSVKLDGVGVNAALTYTLALKPASEMVWA